ncbi:hypothetical protein ISN76_16160 [Dyella halodurans]|uniref:Transposase n=1 Tax=Dyella halodurans TaxID=1920171 RepID=A0ABV9C6B6_9GAMM|nr:hypothetical protein [Dyella halodurans]
MGGWLVKLIWMAIVRLADAFAQRFAASSRRRSIVAWGRAEITSKQVDQLCNRHAPAAFAEKHERRWLNDLAIWSYLAVTMNNNVMHLNPANQPPSPQ